MTTPEDTQADVGSLACSTAKKNYAKGYAAGIRRLGVLHDEIAKLKEIKTPQEVDTHDATIEYLLASAEALVGAAKTLIEMRIRP